MCARGSACYPYWSSSARPAWAPGDAKLALATGLVTGWGGPVTAVWGAVLGFFVAGGYGVFLLVTRRPDSPIHPPRSVHAPRRVRRRRAHRRLTVLKRGVERQPRWVALRRPSSGSSLSASWYVSGARSSGTLRRVAVTASARRTCPVPRRTGRRGAGPTSCPATAGRRSGSGSASQTIDRPTYAGGVARFEIEPRRDRVRRPQYGRREMVGMDVGLAQPGVRIATPAPNG